MLTRLDDFPRHQVVDTMAHVGSTDPSWSDGYYFCIWDKTGEVSLATGLRVYANMDLVEGYAALISGGELKVMRMSRRWSTAYDDLSVGPLTLTILEGLQKRRLQFSAPEAHGGLEFDLIWDARHPPYEEDRRSQRVHGRVVRDLIRYWQAGRPSGRIRLGGREFEVNAQDWYCIMDHSWGTRQSVGPNLNPADFPPTPSLPAGRDGLLRLVGLVQMPSYVMFFQTHEDASGRPQMVEGRIDHKDGRSTPIVSVAHELRYRRGTRALEDNALCRVTDADGEVHELTFRLTHTPTVTSALGYPLETGGFGDNRGMGVYRGETWSETDVWRHEADEVVDPAGRRHAYNGYIGPAGVSDGRAEGMGYFETVVLGSYPRYEFAAEGPVPVTVLPIS